MLDFPVGVALETFSVPIVDHGVQSVPKTIAVSLFGPSPIGMASPNKAVLTILGDDPAIPRDPGNPLALPVAPPAGEPLVGANFFVDPQSEAAHAAQADPTLGVLARQPGTARFGKFSFGSNGVTDIQTAVSRYLSRAAVQSPGSVPLLATYRIVDGHCGHWADPPADQAAYHNFNQGFAQGIGSYRAVVFLEMDSLITMPCLTHHGQAVREAELRDAINRPGHLSRCRRGRRAQCARRGPLPARQRRRDHPGLLPQLDPLRLDLERDPLRPPDLADDRRQALRGQHRRERPGPAAPGRHRSPRHGGPVQPARRAGPLPTATTGSRNVDMFAWTSNPGESGGRCGAGAPGTGVCWPAYAKALVQNADFKVR